jgi:signal transduction histidine kinase
MEHPDQISTLLALVEHPAFCVEEGKITHMNAAAEKLLIPKGIDISELFPQDPAALVTPPEGYLYLTLQLFDSNIGATVSSVANKLVFVLDDQNDDAKLQALALTAQQLRMPLSGILSAMDTLTESEALSQNPQLQDQLAHINLRLYQMLRLVSNMSDAYRYQLDGAAHAETTNLSSFLRELMEQAQVLAEQAGRKLCFTQSRQVIFSQADRYMLERAAYQLVSNAIKFSPKDSTIHVSLCQKGNTVYFSVQNTSEFLLQSLGGDLFSRYTRQPGIEDGRNGLGLGMSVIRSAALAHGGTLLMEKLSPQELKTTIAFPVRQSSQSTVRAQVLRVDPVGDLSRSLMELSDVLSADAFANLH